MPRAPIGMDVSLREITKETLRDVLRLSVAPEQERYVANNSVSIAQAHFHKDAWFRAIYAGDTPVGFVMLSDIPEKAEYFLWRFMIDRNHQRKGYGKRALELLVEHVRTRPGATHLYTSYKVGDGSPEEFYKRFGFVPTGDVDADGEHLARIEL